MAYETRDGEGALFRNNKTKESQPDYSGDCKIMGQGFRIAAWVKTSQRGTKYFSLSIQPKEDQHTPVKQSHTEERNYENWGDSDLDDDIPF